MKIGFIGTGIIGSAMIRGLCRAEIENLSLIISERSKKNSEELKNEFPDKITVTADNQKIADESEWIVLSVLPKQAEEVLKELKFTKDKKIINVVASLPLDVIEDITGGVAEIVDVVPLPFCAKGFGPIIVYPPSKEASEILSNMGDIVQAESAKEMAVLRSITGMMSPYYMLIASLVEWSVKEGVSEENARKYITEFSGALNRMSLDFDGDLKDLANEMTPGGLNWQALTYLEGKDNFKDWQDILDEIVKKVIK